MPWRINIIGTGTDQYYWTATSYDVPVIICLSGSLTGYPWEARKAAESAIKEYEKSHPITEKPY